MALSAQTALCGILLHPAQHTRSPAMHNAAYARLSVDAVYVAFDVPPVSLASAMSGVRALGIRQLSVSLPHKVAVMEHLDRVDETARRIGAVNTVCLRDGELHGSNTDWVGAVRALEQEQELSGRHAVVLGAGGTARAVCYGLIERGAHLTILNRTPDKAHALAQEMGADRAGALDELAGLPYDVLVNTTSVGLSSDASPVSSEALRPDAVVMDAVYEPERTRLLADAQSRGARTISGKWMLVYQAVAQLEAWCDAATGREREVTRAMKTAFESASREASRI